MSEFVPEPTAPAEPVESVEDFADFDVQAEESWPYESADVGYDAEPDLSPEDAAAVQQVLMEELGPQIQASIEEQAAPILQYADEVFGRQLSDQGMEAAYEIFDGLGREQGIAEMDDQAREAAIEAADEIYRTLFSDPEAAEQMWDGMADDSELMDQIAAELEQSPELVQQYGPHAVFMTPSFAAKTLEGVAGAINPISHLDGSPSRLHTLPPHLQEQVSSVGKRHEGTTADSPAATKPGSVNARPDPVRAVLQKYYPGAA